MASNPLDSLAHHVATTVYEDLPPAAVMAAKTFVLDILACGVAGTSKPDSALIREAALGWGRGDDASIWGRAGRIPAPAAALVNAYQIHCLEFDCVHEGAVLHPLTALLPAVMADAEHAKRNGRTISGRDLIAALAVGVDVACTLALSSRVQMKFFRPASIGGFAATAGVARLRSFDPARTAAALGIMYGQTSGTMQPHVEGSHLIALQIGFAARSALVAADLAGVGIDGPKDIITGPYGYLPLFEGDYDLSETWQSWGKIWRLTEMSHKPFPSGRPTHYAIQALLELQTAHGFKADEIARVICRVPPLPGAVVGRPDVPIPNPTYAKLCLPFLCATVLLRGNVAPGDFTPEALVDPITHALAAKVTVERDDNPDLNAFGPQTVIVELTSGVRHQRTIASAIGSPLNPLTREQQLAKFWWCWETAVHLPRAAGEQLLENVDSLERLADVTTLTDSLIPS